MTEKQLKVKVLYMKGRLILKGFYKTLSNENIFWHAIFNVYNCSKESNSF